MWTLFAIELCVVVLLHRHELAGVWEVETGVLWLLPTALAIGAPLGILGAGAFALVRKSEALNFRLVLVAWVGLSAAGAGWGVGGGRHLAELSQRAGFALLVGALAAGATYGLAPRLARGLRRQPLWIALAVVGSIVFLEIANRLVLPRLYPVFHWTLALLTVLLAPAAYLAATEIRARASSRTAVILGLSLVVPAALVIPTAESLARLDNFRFVLLERAPILGRIIEIAGRISPPEISDPSGFCGTDPSCNEAPSAVTDQSVDLAKRDILLVTIDALRADHVGAYGYSRPTTPNLDQLAREGVVLEQAYTATPHTSYAIVSLMTGKYMRPLLLQGAGTDSDTWASLLRTYGYRTAGFFPPAVFFIDTPRFESFQKNSLGFEYVKVEFAEGETRIAQVSDYIAKAPPETPLFIWVHLFGPHEPYVAHPAYPFGDRDIDRYDSEIAESDATLGAIVKRFRASRPKGVVFVSADHGEEFGEHGGRYHGTTVYEEQLRVPLVVSAPGLLAARRVREVVSTIDLLPTVLSGLAIPRPPRLRGRDLGPLLTGKRAEEAGLAHGEAEDQALLARGDSRLICARRIGACKLYDLSEDPGQTVDVSATQSAQFEALRAELRALGASHGRYESQGLRAEGKGLPGAIVRGLAGDGEAALELAELLDDVDPSIRRKSAEILVELRRPETAPALRLALGRDEDPDVRKHCALALTRLGEGAPLVLELLTEPRYRRMAALALAESGDSRGRDGLLEWWRDKASREFSRSKQLLSAIGTLRLREAVPLLAAELEDVRLRPEIARALAQIGDESGRMPLARALANERSHSTRQALFEALVELGGRYELVLPLVRFLGVPDPLPEGLAIAMNARILGHVGGPTERDLPRLKERSELGTRVRLVIPKGGNGQGIRALARVECSRAARQGELVIGSAEHLIRYDRAGKPIRQRTVPELDTTRALRLPVACSGQPTEVYGSLPENMPARPGSSLELIVYASRDVKVHGLALVPLSDELPPPPPEPWQAENSRGGSD